MNRTILFCLGQVSLWCCCLVTQNYSVLFRALVTINLFKYSLHCQNFQDLCEKKSYNNNSFLHKYSVMQIRISTVKSNNNCI